MTNMNTSYYFKEISKIPVLTSEEEKALAAKARAGNKWAQNKLVEHNLRLVAKIANKYQGYMEMEDLMSAGNIGLIKAAAKFNPENGAKFSTYSAFWIRAEIQQAIRDTSTGVRFPATRFEDMKKWKVASLDKSIGCDEDGDVTLGNLIEDEKFGDPQDEVCEKETHIQLEKSLGKLDEREMTVMVKRFGLDGSEPLSLSQIGKEMGYSKETIRKIEMNSLEKLRENILCENGYGNCAA
ncbi:RNA polymerase sigma factor RpoD/SigA [Treponema sp.]|uniref:sigma-70 family RNA polymerase sigma factor n=1 Tax=Treponema sp. TaxID=166 RepID=UPI00298E58D0|nr:RNA polymerase sigma factor RpoD/SigA [Treponema sp.]MCQ2240042.1 RNA polymerase sigma factor RpoD/SigA [Treponema sp.]